MLRNIHSRGRYGPSSAEKSTAQKHAVETNASMVCGQQHAPNPAFSAVQQRPSVEQLLREHAFLIDRINQIELMLNEIGVKHKH